MDKNKKQKKIAIILIITAIILILIGMMITFFKNNNEDEKNYKVTFIVDNNEYDIQKVMSNGIIYTYPKVPQKDGYIFSYWEYNGKEYTETEEITSDITLTAVFKEREKVIVTFNKDNGEKSTTKEIYKNDKVTSISNPKKTGYEFIGWYLDRDDEEYDEDELFLFETEIEENITLIAKWEPLVYIITFDSNGGSSVSSKVVDYKNKVKIPTEPTREGYKFLGWYLDDKKYDFNTNITKDMTLVAKWEVLSYTVKFDSVGGSSIDSQKINYNNKVTKPTTPIKEGYKFIEWMLNGKTYDFDNKITKDITLIAKWESRIPTELPKPKIEINGSPFNRIDLKETISIQCEYDIKLTNYKDYIYQEENGEYKYFIDEYHVIENGKLSMTNDDIEETLEMLLDFGDTYEIYLKVVRKNSKGEVVASSISDSIIIDTKRDMTPELTLGIFKCSSSWDFCDVLLEDGLYKYRLNVFGSVGVNFDGGIIEIYEKENGSYTYIGEAGHESGLFVKIAPNTKKTYVARACLTNSLSQKMCGNYSNELIIDTSKES